MCLQITSVVRRAPGGLSTVLCIYLHLLGMTQLSLMLCYSFLLAAYRLHQADESGWPNSSSSKYFLETFPFPFIALISFVYVVFFRFLVCGIYMDQSFWFADHDQTEEDYRIDTGHVLYSICSWSHSPVDFRPLAPESSALTMEPPRRGRGKYKRN